MRILMACRQDQILSMPEMVARLGLGEAMVLKSCQELMQAGYITGLRGRGGGYRLARAPSLITVMEIVDLFEPEENLFPCRLNLERQCSIVAACKLRCACESAYAAFRAELDTLTLADLSLEPTFKNCDSD
ncbi:MAG: Rrf2 family transcriptional regulator [Methylocella sp.]